MQEVSSNTFIPPHPLKTAVLFLVFNRPDTTKQVFEAIRKAKPPRLYVAADGPRTEKFGEAEKVEQVRRIATQVDWDCVVKTLFREKNLGCGVAVSSAIDWFFENVEEGIILEDDCLPHPTFFKFCQELLERYRYDERIMHIAGYNPHLSKRFGSASYYFSKYNLIWGWATWRRSWQFFNTGIKKFNTFLEENIVTNIFRSKAERYYFKDRFKDTFYGNIDSWGYIWLYSRCIAGSYSIHPNCNLVQNIGFGNLATHTTSEVRKIVSNLATNMGFPLKHPDFFVVNEEADQNTFRMLHCDNIYKYLLRKIINIILRKIK